MADWHNLSTHEVLQKLDSRRSGLTESEVKERLQSHGPNELTSAKKPPAILVFARQFLSPLIYVLLVAAVISVITGHYMDAIVVFVVLFLNAAIGYFQETQAERAMDALMEMAAPKAKARRNGELESLPARELVPGDIILLEAGDKVPADARLIDASNVKSNESALTGESMPVEKHAAAIHGEASIADRNNMVHMGTIVTNGRATGVIVSTGMSTEMGKIATGLQGIEQEQTPLQQSIAKLSRYLVFLFLGVTGLLLVVGLLQGLGW
ncbi:MAG: HAD-IC family P-type ATPase, partial [Dehalococcoidia bacterium]|nr:HAD-IC family P-type ATPase [Dehalococcoidia bacterium]